ncbi:MAG: thiamine pyrophosphate-dependent enzyme [Candidatus Asgardarchaeia archaeon]
MSQFVKVIPDEKLREIFNVKALPHILCPGCGTGTVMNSVARAIKSLNLDLDKVVIVSGIGCSGRAYTYFNTDAIHTTHGRTLPLATAIKVVRPDLHVIVISGDGDLFAIGGNHFIHAARRNIDLTVISINNFTYGMTGGQLGPTTPSHSITTTSSFGHLEHPFNLVQLAASAGAVFVARWTTYHVYLLQKSIEKAIMKKGFAFIDVVSQCPTYYGRYNNFRNAANMVKHFKEVSVIKMNAKPEEAIIDPHNKIVVGEFVNIERPEFSERINNFIKSAAVERIIE